MYLYIYTSDSLVVGFSWQTPISGTLSKMGFDGDDFVQPDSPNFTISTATKVTKQCDTICWEDYPQSSV